MPSIRQQLPPLDALVMFDAAARHMSFTLAADELNITQAAVSRQIRLLEEDLGIRLFVRAHRNVELTPEGRAFQHSVHSALLHLCDATNEIRHIPQANIVVAVDQAIAGLWLTPRISEFFSLYPDVSIRIIASDSQSECLEERVDVAILHGDGYWPGFKPRLLFREEIFPVCSPAFIAKFGDIASPRALVDLPLIEHEDERWDWMNWRVWLTANNIELPHKHHKLLINNYAFMIRAAEAGHGVALGWRCLVDESLQSGRLVRPMKQTLTTKLGYYLLVRDQSQTNATVEAFADWVFEIQRSSMTVEVDDEPIEKSRRKR